jgi:UDP-3-O-[3-hydroxymyristoyl] N-acetylglucosamine deacetylase
VSFDDFSAARAEPLPPSSAPTPAKGVVRQRTLAEPAAVTGVGVHSGESATATLHPMPADCGIAFRRTDLPGAPLIPARFDRVVDTRMCTVLAGDDGVTVGTVEHLMAALAGCGIDNCEILIDGPEVPIMDGSSEPFVAAIRAAGAVEQDAPRRVIRILDDVTVEDGDARVTLSPADRFSVDVEIAYDNDVIGSQRVSLGIVNGAFCKELSNARTYGFLHEVDALRRMGLARGGSLDNAIVIDGETILNGDGLRRDDEFVRHKALDAVGDMYLAGAQIIGAFTGRCSGHTTNNAVLRALFAQPGAWTFDTLDADEADLAVDGGMQARA